MRKRISAILLSLCLIVGSLPGAALAAETEPAAEAQPEAVEAAPEAAEEVTPFTTIDDHTPPVVTGVYMNSPGATVTVGDTLLFTVSVEDESGIDMFPSYLTFVYVCDQGHSHTEYADGEWNDYDEETKLATFSLEITEEMLNGTYTLYEVSVWDNYRNCSRYTYENSDNINFDSICFTITGSPAAEDHTPPVVTSVYMNSPGVTVTVGDTLWFTVSVEDESGIDMFLSSLHFAYTCNQGKTHYISAPGWLNGIYDEEEKMATFSLEITEDTLNGTYTLDSVTIWDTCHNRHEYNLKDPGTIDFGSICFTVTGSPAVEDHAPPVVAGINMDNPGVTVTVGDTLLFTVSTEDQYGINVDASFLYFTYVCAQGHSHTEASYGERNDYDEESKTATFSLEITEDMLNGTYALDSVTIIDNYGNIGYYNREEPGTIDFDSICFTIATPDIFPESVTIPAAASLPVRSAYTIRPTVEPSTSVPKWTWVSADTGIAEVVLSENGKSCTVVGVSPGTTTITGTTQNGLTASCAVTITEAPLPESGTVDSLYTVGVGGFVQIEPVLTPDGATTLYEVTSDNPHVAGIGTTPGNAGIRIEGHNAGTATITIRCANHVVMTTTVKVGRDEDRQHEKEIREGRAPTCTRDGWTDAVVCSACRYVFTEAETIPATGHSFGDWVIVREPTATTDGLQERICENCGRHEREIIPATGDPSGDSGSSGDSGESGDSGNSGNSGSSSGSGNSGGSSSGNKAPVDAGGQKLEATVDGDTANISATEEQVAEMIENSSADGTVHIDASSAEGVSEIGISQNIIAAIHDSKDVSGLSIQTAAGKVDISGEALETISTALTGENDQIAIKVEPMDVNKIPSTQKYPIANVLNSAVFVELSATVVHKNSSGKTTSTESIHEFNGNMTVSVPYTQPENMAGRQIIACYIAEDGAVTYFPVHYENGIATFTTTHFSMFAVVESLAAALQDVDISAWYMLGVEYVLQNGLMRGYNGEAFGADDQLSRAQLAQILYNREGRPAAAADRQFTDTEPSAWYADAISWAAESGIVSGYSDGRFGPGEHVTREQLATMLWRYAGSPSVSSAVIHPFTDSAEVAAYAAEAMNWAVSQGLISGTGDGQLAPKTTATRAQIATILMRYFEKNS